MDHLWQEFKHWHVFDGAFSSIGESSRVDEQWSCTEISLSVLDKKVNKI